MGLRALVVALVLSGAAASARAGEPLLVPSQADGPAPRGMGAVATFAVDAGAAGRLRRAAHRRVERFPLGPTRVAALDLERVDPLAGVRIEIVDDGGARTGAAPDLAFFRGTVVGDPDSLAIVTLGREWVRSVVLEAGGASVVGPDAAGRHRAWSLADVDAAVHAPPSAFCLNDLGTIHHGPASRPRLAAPSLAWTDAAETTLRRADVAIETDQELRDRFASDAEALAYVATVFAEASAVYERDLGLRLRASYVRLWNTTDPWQASSPDGQLDELQRYWNDPRRGMDTLAGPRAAVLMLSGKPVLGGIAYIDAVCATDWAYAVSQVYGAFDVATPSDVWDLVVVMHELGHTFGSEHTHCYPTEPIDRCFNAEPGCYAGPIVVSQGTLMSYCHLHEGGLANIDLRFHERVQARIQETTLVASCLGADVDPTCGNGLLDDLEGCDDGNRIGGDGCSPTCRLEVCGNGLIDAGEGCDDGNRDAGDGCSPVCSPEVCGNGTRDAGEECDDGNRVAGDGCSVTCARERCALLVPHQRVWNRAKLVVRPNAGGTPSLALRAGFEVPTDAPIDVGGAGLTVVLEGDTESSSLEIHIPAGDAWRTKGARLRYRDPTGAADGVRRVVLRARPGPDLTRVKLVVRAAGGSGYPATAAALPTRITVLLGDDTAAGRGACGQWIPAAGACRAVRGGRRLLCD